jgi:glutathione S-transferase
LLARFLPTLDAQLREREYLAGTLTVADFAAVPYQHAFEQAGLLENLNGITAWLDRMRVLPAWNAVSAQPAPA